MPRVEWFETVRGHDLGSNACSYRSAAPLGAGWCPGPLRALPPRSGHAVPLVFVKDEFDAFLVPRVLNCFLLARGPEGRRGPQRRGNADPALRFGRQPQHPPALPGAETGAAPKARRSLLRRLRRAMRRCRACCTKDHDPHPEAADTAKRAGRGARLDVHGRQRCRFGRRPHAKAAAGRGPSRQLSHRVRWLLESG